MRVSSSSSSGKGYLSTIKSSNYVLYHNSPEISTVETVKNSSNSVYILRQGVEIDALDEAKTVQCANQSTG